VARQAEAAAAHAESVAATQLELWQGASLSHPRANREACLAGVRVAYEFQRSTRRTIGLSVGPQGLSVRAPHRAPWAEVERFLQSRAQWVLDKWRLVQVRQQHTQAAQPVWAEGASLDYLGQRLRLRLDPGHRFEGVGAAVVEEQLHVALPASASAEQIRQAVQAWLMRQAQTLFAQRLAHFAPQLGVRPARLSLSSAGTRWGSASADGRIRLNWRLIHLSPELIDYVVVHELAHLREMNHSPAFWRWVEQILPDQAERRRRLKAVVLHKG